MSSDPFADLGKTLARFAAELGDLFRKNEMPAAGSPADRESDGEPYAGAWGAGPSREVFATVAMSSASCADHLTVASHVLSERSGLHSVYTLSRGALEAAAKACYLTEPGIDPLERIRRHMNLALLALREDARMHRRIPGAEAAAKVARHDAREDVIGSVGQSFGLTFTKAKRDNQAHLGEKPRGAMTMIEQCAPGAPALRSAYQLLSSVAHSQWNGHSLLLARTRAEACGRVSLQLNAALRDMAIHLFAAPLCGAVLAERLRWYLGWDCDDLNAFTVMMLDNWGRIAGIPRPVRLT